MSIHCRREPPCHHLIFPHPVLRVNTCIVLLLCIQNASVWMCRRIGARFKNLVTKMIKFYVVTLGLDCVTKSIDCICELNKDEVDFLTNHKIECGGCSSNNRCIVCAGAYVKSVKPTTMFNININENLVYNCLRRICAQLDEID